ncbi:MAG: MFS transporter [Pirellulaceae bacterium]
MNKPASPPPSGNSPEENPYVSSHSGEDQYATDERPAHLKSDPAFWGMTGTQFLGAFNDNLFKQLLLLVAVGAAGGRDRQGEAMVVFAIPFLLFAGPSGYLADKFRKSAIVFWSKVAEIVAMGLGMLAFFWFDLLGFGGLLFVLFLMGMQSTFFAPAKYGILPEMLHEHDLPKANGIFLMTTFLAIIFGTALAGVLSDQLADQRWMAVTVCVGIAVLGTLASTTLRRGEPSRPRARLNWDAIGMPRKVRRLLLRDHKILTALLASCAFWLCAGVVQQSVNSLGKVQLELDDTKTSMLAGSIGAGIGIGCFIAGFLSRGRIEFGLVRLGIWGMIVCLALMALPGFDGGHLLGFYGSLPVLIALGVFTGMFSVPIQVYLQARAPKDQKGQVIAEMSRANWLAIFLSGLLYSLFDLVLVQTESPRHYLFGLTVLILLPVALLYRPQTEELE